MPTNDGGQRSRRQAEAQTDGHDPGEGEDQHEGDDEQHHGPEDDVGRVTEEQLA